MLLKWLRYQNWGGGKATEHSYRPAIQKLFNDLGQDINALNEPKHVDCGAPDFLIYRGDFQIGHVEAKDLSIDIRNMKNENADQHKRYVSALPNLIYTNCLDWDFYKDGERICSVSIGKFSESLEFNRRNFDVLDGYLRTFIHNSIEKISNPKTLAVTMAAKAHLIKDILLKTLEMDEEKATHIFEQYEEVKESLISSIDFDEFADIYAETVTHGMFVARLYSNDQEFNRQKAVETFPKHSPFLRRFFGHIAGAEIDDQIRWIIDDLALMFSACDVEDLMNSFNNDDDNDDPFLYFYETFLSEYNSSSRIEYGVWYTPQPVVSFIVRAVNDILVDRFHLNRGLADISKIEIDFDTGMDDDKGGKITEKKVVHRVQIMDPATGTGTFLVEVISQVVSRIKMGGESLLSSYIEEELLPRLHGMEVRMASYAVCFAKLDMALRKLHYKPSKNSPRMSVYLTDSLADGFSAIKEHGFAQWLTQEAKGARSIKTSLPIMCVIGNPPYNADAKSEGWIRTLMDDYKKEPGGQMPLKERNSKWINDLYVQFMRVSSHFIEKNGDGVMALITNHSYIENPTFRGMRWHLLRTFDEIWILDLHGNVKRTRTPPDGRKDENVFDIQQGVAIIIAVKTKGDNENLAKVMHGDLWGTRSEKFEFLENSSFRDDLFSEVMPRDPYYIMSSRDYSNFDIYHEGFLVSEMMPHKSIGIVTSRDKFTIDFDESTLKNRVHHFVKLDVEEARTQYNLTNDTDSWSIAGAQRDLRPIDAEKFVKIKFRPFDIRWTYYTGVGQGFMARPRDEVMSHMVGIDNNIALSVTKNCRSRDHFSHVICHEYISDSHLTSDVTSVFPLYVSSDICGVDQGYDSNLNNDLVNRLKNISVTSDFPEMKSIDVFDYMYGVLHCPEYRITYREYFEIDYPRIPWPRCAEEFWNIVSHGRELRKLHLMKDNSISLREDEYSLQTLQGDGDNTIIRASYSEQKIWINKTQYFDNVTEDVWNHNVGGYFPAQKWLKDRKHRSLSYEESLHYRNILKILLRTGQIMQEINFQVGSSTQQFET